MKKELFCSSFFYFCSLIYYTKMNCKLLVVLLFFSFSVAGQSAFKKATFKAGSAKEFILKNFQQKSTTLDKNEYIVISFTLTKRGEIKHTYPTKFIDEDNAANAILAIQKTAGKWKPTLVNNKPVDASYKIVFNFLTKGNTYAKDVLFAQKYFDQKEFKKSLKYFDKAIEVNKDEPILYYKRAEVKNALKDVGGTDEDLEKFYTLNKEILLQITLY